MKLLTGLSGMAALVLTLSAAAQESPASVKVGADLRFRLTDISDVPLENASNSIQEDLDLTFYRLRTRVWAESEIDANTKFYGRVTNEFRNAWGSDADDSWEALDEVVIDNAYVDVANLIEGSDFNLRVGRQDLVYGTGKIILDGTPLDGSRTTYFNAVKGTLTLPDNVVDVLAIYNTNEDPVVINDQDRDLIGDGVDKEWALGAYWKMNKISSTSMEAYFIYKNESLDGPDKDFSTLGFRIAPDFTPNLSGNFELALQDGDYGGNDIDGQMFDVLVSYHAGGDLDPAVLGGYYYLSGDDDRTDGDDDNWQQVFGRWPQFSELYAYSLAASEGGYSNWTNMSVPYVGYEVSPIPQSRLKLRYYNMNAVSVPAGADKQRGDLFTARFDYQVNDKVKGHLVHEWFRPGSYYSGSAEDNTHFSRAEISFRF